LMSNIFTVKINKSLKKVLTHAVFYKLWHLKHKIHLSVQAF
jgi:hypothetical protein